MSSLLIKDIGTLVISKLESPLRQANSIFIEDGIVQAIGNDLNQKADQVINANGITAIPGLIDSHSHPSIGEYTPFTPSATNVGQASTDAVKEIVHDLFAG